MPRKKIGYPKKKKAAPKRRKVARSKPSKFFSPVGKYLGGAIGGYLGGPLGAGIGAGIGSSAGSMISKLTGFGSYKVMKNTISADSIPQFTSRMGDGSIRIRHKEFITDVISSATPGQFLPIVYHLSASDQQTFPYLSQLAVNFEEFAFEGLVFEYITSSGSLSTTGQLGTVVGATQFNSLAAPYANKQQMEASTFGQSTVASQSCLFPVECDASQTPSNGIFYNQRPGISNVNNDLRWSQLGNFSLATVGMPNASETVGELYVSYDCVLFKPILIQDSGAAADHWTATTGISIAAPIAYFGTDAALTAQSDNFTTVATDLITFDPSFHGKVQILYAISGDPAGWIGPDFTPLTGATALNILINDSINYLDVFTNVGLNYTTTVGFFTINPVGGVGAQIQLTGGNFANPTTLDVIITQIPADFD